MPKRMSNAYPFLLFILAVISFLYILDGKLDLNGDNVGYYLLGKALYLGKGYVNLYSPIEAPHNLYPPGYPVIIAGVMYLFGENVMVIKGLNGLFFASTIPVLYLLFLRITQNPNFSFVACIFILLNSSLLMYSTIMMSEIPFLFFSVLSLLFLMRIPNDRSYQDRSLYLALLCAVAAFYLRSVGMALIASILLLLLIRRQWLGAIISTASCILLILPWLVRSAFIGGTSYLKPLLLVNPYQPELGQAGIMDLVVRFFNNLSRYIVIEIPNSTLNFIHNDPSSFAILPALIGMIVIGTIGYGIYKLSTHRTLLVVYMAATFGIILLWPEVWFGARFLVPLIPFLTFFIVFGSFHLIQFMMLSYGWQSKLHPAILLLFAVLFFSDLKTLNTFANVNYPPEWTNYLGIAQWVGQNTAPDVIVCCRKPAFFYLFSNRKTTGFKNTSDQPKLIADLEAKQVDFVVLDTLGFVNTERFLLPAIKDNPELFTTEMYLEKPNTYLFKFKPKGSPEK